MASLRKTNKSHKVPNVKLRPALPPSNPKTRKTASTDPGFESDHETSFADTCPRPFRGVVLCTTGITDKTTIFKQAFELGAQPLNDLTDKVTHLLAVETGSAKYKCAVENKLQIMHPSWITDLYEVWLRGDDVDLDESVRKYRLPTFTGVVLCISGIQDEAKRVNINKLVTSEGGTYVKDITRPVKVTHLLCSAGIEEGSEKVQYAQKFNEKGEADIRIVWEQWFWDSREAKGCRDEEIYNITKPLPTRKPTPEREQPIQPSLDDVEKAAPAPSKAPLDTVDLFSGEEEHVIEARLPPVTMQAWEGMLRSRGFQRRGGNFYTSPSGVHSQPSRSDDAERAAVQSQPRPLARHITEGQKSVLAAFKRIDSFAPPVKDTSTQRQPRPFARVATVPDVSSFLAPEIGTIIAQGGEELAVVSCPNKASRSLQHGEKKGLFAGLVFRPMGEARSPNVREAVEGAGGRIVLEDADDDIHYIVVRLVSGSRLYRGELEESERAKYRTECWLERCINEGRICDPDEHVLFIPLKVETPIPGAEAIVLSHSGLTEEEVCWMIKRLARALGFTISSAFSRRSTHLLCPSRSGIKFEKAQEWGVSLVDMQWLTDIATTGIIPSSSGNKSDARVIPPRCAESAPNLKGKGKEKALDPPEAMIDITNSHPPELPLLLRARSKSPERASRKEPGALLPNGLLGLSQSAEDTPSATQPSGEVDPTHSPVLAPQTPSRDRARTASRPFSLVELRDDMKNTRIPSSVSPTSVKSTSKPTSPVKLDVQAAVGLSDSINSLIKRCSEDSEVIVERKSKRARPASRSTTMTEVRPHIQEPPASEARSVFDPFPHDDASVIGGAGTQQGSTVRVLYEDPAQSNERQRLMQLLGEKDATQEAWDVGKESQTGNSRGTPTKATGKGQSRKAPRRSTRANARR